MAQVAELLSSKHEALSSKAPLSPKKEKGYKIFNSLRKVPQETSF
jgi:hypothetical protein